jgi:hypothetical protein
MTHDSDIPLPEDDASAQTSADAYVQRLIDGDLAPHEESDALHAIADDADARSTLRFELQWSPDAARSAGRPPPQFADTVMAAVLKDASSTIEAPHEKRALDRIMGWLASLGSPVEVRVRLLPALLIMVGMLVGVWGLRGAISSSPSKPGAPGVDRTTEARTTDARITPVSSESAERVWIRFVYTGDEAENVAVAGDFSKWEPIPLSSRTVDGQIIWTGLVPVRRGEHEYQFVINGERWVTDPLAPIQRNDGFGATNAVLKL